MVKTAVVILNFNGKKFLEQFLPGVIRHSPDCEVIVADNCSTDDSVSCLENQFPEVRLIKLDKNNGYSAGYNEALKQVEADYYVLLNSDVEVTTNWVEPIIDMMDSDPTICAAQPKILSFHNKDEFEYARAAGGYIDTLGFPFCRGRLFLTLEKDQNQYDDIKQIFWATGACMFVRSSVFKEMNGFDPDFFAHMEEIDLCWRMNNAGYKVMYNGNSHVYHVGGGTLHKSNPRKTYLNFRNGLSLLYKNYHSFELWLKFPVRIALDLVAAIKFMMFDTVKDGLAVFKAHIDFYLQLPKNYKKRSQTRRLRNKRHRMIIFSGAVVFEYFIKGKRKFSQLKF